MSSKTTILHFVMTSQSFLLPRFSSSVSSQTKKENIQFQQPDRQQLTDSREMPYLNSWQIDQVQSQVPA